MEAASSTKARQRRREEFLMKIGSIGKGNVGGTLTRLWQQAGHDVRAGGRDDSVADIAAHGDVVLLAVGAEDPAARGREHDRVRGGRGRDASPAGGDPGRSRRGDRRRPRHGRSPRRVLAAVRPLRRPPIDSQRESTSSSSARPPGSSQSSTSRRSPATPRT
jgi:hypothetical protein